VSFRILANNEKTCIHPVGFFGSFPACANGGDQKEKLYVQHRMQQQSKELFEWLENGAHVYICGCKDPMAKDVETTLLNIISTEANIDKAGAIEYLEKMEEEGRFAIDVY